MAGLYIHIPFCASRCIYCNFYSTTRHSVRSQYVDALMAELALRKDFLDGDSRIETIYIGGGTPSQLSREDLSRLMQYIYNVCDCHLVETTIEVNPDDVTDSLAQCLAECGFNRVSMGAQTFDDERLKFLRRRHTANQVARAVDRLRHHGIGNISIDLIYGFPSETMDEWHEDIKRAIALDVNHISAYSLTYEQGTPLYALMEKGEIREVDDELSLGMYEHIVEMLKSHGYEHYEISNFAKKGYRSVHNSSYWSDVPYLGIGAAAHSYNRKTRQWNVLDVDKYIASIRRGEVPCESEDIDEDTHYNDIVATALRTCDGISLSSLREEQADYLLKGVEKYIDDGLMELTDGRIRISEKGVFVSDMIMSDLMKV